MALKLGSITVHVDGMRTHKLTKNVWRWLSLLPLKLKFTAAMNYFESRIVKTKSFYLQILKARLTTMRRFSKLKTLNH